MAIRTKIKSLETSHNVLWQVTFYALRIIWRPFKFFLDGSYRSQILGKMRFRKHYLQGPTTTVPNRYPLLFNACADYLAETPDPSILSFGCSTGEEVFSIGQLIPQAHILGVDINPWCIRQAKRKAASLNHTFVHRLSKEFESAEGFDAIFCMAVF